ncbi:hypothetical protein [Streptomyces sp. NBC_01751]|nr:hypothetical protein [Streptomyces sp. NBC_01751]WSD23393.1 hypothetical protein OHA26_07820 [Streptomyces sp. NBC_01751]
MTYMAAKLAFFKAVSPTRSFPDRWVNYDGATIVAEETREHVRLFPTSP